MWRSSRSVNTFASHCNCTTPPVPFAFDLNTRLCGVIGLQKCLGRCQSKIHVSPSMQAFPAEHCIGSRWEALLTLLVSGHNYGWQVHLHVVAGGRAQKIFKAKVTLHLLTSDPTLIVFFSSLRRSQPSKARSTAKSQTCRTRRKSLAEQRLTWAACSRRRISWSRVWLLARSS